MLATALIAVPVMALLTVVQTAVFPQLPIFGVTPALPFLFALAWSLLRGLEEGLVWAFVGGIFMDLFTIAPMGGSSLTYMAAVTVAALVNQVLPPNRFLIPIVLGALATTVQTLLYGLFLRLFGYESGFSIGTLSQTILVQTAVLLPMYWALYLAGRMLRPRPVTL